MLFVSALTPQVFLLPWLVFGLLPYATWWLNFGGRSQSGGGWAQTPAGSAVRGLAVGIGLCMLLEVFAAPAVFQQLYLVLPGVSSELVLLACLVAGLPLCLRLGPEVPLLLGVNLSSSLMLLWSFDLQSFFLNLELQSLSTLALVGTASPGGGPSAPAVRYFLLGSGSSGLLALSVALTYALTGTLGFQDLLLASSLDSASVPGPGFISLGLLPAAFSAGFKLGLFPFHAWVLDAFASLPLWVSVAVTSVGKIPGLVSFQHLFSAAGGLDLAGPGSVLVLLALVSIGYGSLGLIQGHALQPSLGWLSVGSSGVASLAAFQANPLGVAVGSAYALAGFPVALGIAGARAGTGSWGCVPDLGPAGPGPRWALPGIVSLGFALLLIFLAALPPSVLFFGKALILLEMLGRGLVLPALVVVFGGLLVIFFSIRLLARLPLTGVSVGSGRSGVAGLRLLGFSILASVPLAAGLPALSDLVLGFARSLPL